MTGSVVRLMVVGVPNVGKSSLINRLAGGRRAKVEDRPGVTRGKQWITAGGLEILDMPGVLWPKFEDSAVGESLALTGAVKDDVIDIEALALRLALRLQADYPKLLYARYRIGDDEATGLDAYGLLTLIGRKRGMLLPGGGINLERAAIMLLDEFRSAAIGRITLERP
jgi:ribosome biogenesis GTPase A